MGATSGVSPDRPSSSLLAGLYHLLSGAISVTWARTGRIDRLSGGLCRSDDFEAVKQRLAKFAAAGFLAIREQRAKGGA
ncbi:MAG TPA: hypothetical protein VD866_23345 [Urbifossiella sp.]|nr:hypothetical protein [Urbifossiella sp.]